MLSESHYQWLDPIAFPGRLIVPRSDPHKYEQQADLLFDTIDEAIAWRDEELAAYEYKGFPVSDEHAYISRWVLCRRTVEQVQIDDSGAPGGD